MDEKQLTAKLITLCEKKYPEEFKGKYVGTRQAFRDWMNEKTNLSVCHLTNKEHALKKWITALENQEAHQ